MRHIAGPRALRHAVQVMDTVRIYHTPVRRFPSGAVPDIAIGMRDMTSYDQAASAAARRNHFALIPFIDMIRFCGIPVAHTAEVDILPEHKEYFDPQSIPTASRALPWSS